MSKRKKRWERLVREAGYVNHRLYVVAIPGDPKNGAQLTLADLGQPPTEDLDEAMNRVEAYFGTSQAREIGDLMRARSAGIERYKSLESQAVETVEEVESIGRRLDKVIRDVVMDAVARDVLAELEPLAYDGSASTNGEERVSSVRD